MDASINLFLSQRELASSVGVGPRYIKVDGEIRYPVDEVQIYERSCLYFDPAEVALQTLSH